MARPKKALAADEHTMTSIIKRDGSEEYHINDFVISSEGRLYVIKDKNNREIKELEGRFTDKNKAHKAIIAFLEKARNEKDDSDHGNSEL